MRYFIMVITLALLSSCATGGEVIKCKTYVTKHGPIEVCVE